LPVLTAVLPFKRALIVALTFAPAWGMAESGAEPEAGHEVGQGVEQSVEQGEGIESPKTSALSGGGTTVIMTGRNSFSQPSANMPLLQRLDFSVGNSFFRNPWVIAPSSTTARDGLGPLFNTNGCQNCHIKDGRGHAPQEDDIHAVSLLIRLSIPATSEEQRERLHREGGIADPVYGGQLQDFAIPGVEPEGQVAVRYLPWSMVLDDGTSVSLRWPQFSIESLNYGPLHPEIMLSPRIAPPMIGLGLLEAIPDAALEALADPEDRDGDGISGRLNRVWDQARQTTAIGRFGWKAGQPTLRQQNAAAFNGDLGITSTLFVTDECTTEEVACRRAPNGGAPEVSDKILQSVTFYSQNLAVPARRNVKEPEVLVGEQLFDEIGCGSCHTPTLTTGDAHWPWLAGQTIHPYSDLLLHDMGERLADNRPEFLASGQEWRTPPLWGIGLTKAVTGQESYLHDGRAESLQEAILWHGGEAAASQGRFRALAAEQRAALLAFLRSL